MVSAGVLMIVFGLYGVYLAIRKKLGQGNKWFMRLMIPSIFLPHIANTAGWIMTEIGRQPWTVFGYLRTEDSVSPGVTAGEVLFSLISFSTIYTILAIVMAVLFVRVIKKGPQVSATADVTSHDPFDRRERHAVS